MPQYISQELFDRLAFALVLNSDPELTDLKSAAEVSRFLSEVKSVFHEDDFLGELFQSARWLRRWTDGIFGPHSISGFLLVQQINERCLRFYPSGGRRPPHTSDTLALAPAIGERFATFQANVAGYTGQVEELTEPISYQ